MPSTLRTLHPGSWVRRLVRPSNQNHRVLHILSSLNVGGMEQFVVRMARHQRERGADVGLLAITDGVLRGDAVSAGIRVATLDGRGLARRVMGAMSVAAQRAPDIVHAHNTTSFQYGALCASLLGCPYLMTFHGQGSGARQTSRFQWQTVAAVAVVSRATTSKVERFVRSERVHVVPNGIEILPRRGAREQKREELGLGSGPVGVMVARVDGLKGHDDLLDALAILREGPERLTVLIVGDGTKRAELEARASRLGLNESWVRFLGQRSDVPDLLECSDLFVLPSLTEGMPLSVLEAMAAGLPVVATNVGGIPELITHGREGLLVDKAQPRALASALRQALSEPPLLKSLGEAGAVRARQEFSIDRMLDRYDELYRLIS